MERSSVQYLDDLRDAAAGLIAAADRVSRLRPSRRTRPERVELADLVRAFRRFHRAAETVAADLDSIPAKLAQQIREIVAELVSLAHPVNYGRDGMGLSRGATLPPEFGERVKRLRSLCSRVKVATDVGGIQGPRHGSDRAIKKRKDPIPLVWLREVVPPRTVKGDAKKLAMWLERRDVRTSKIAGKLHAERAELLKPGAFGKHPKVAELIRQYAP